MLSHVEMPTAAVRIKLFGKVITAVEAQKQPMHRALSKAAAAPPRLLQASGRGNLDLLEEAARARAAAAEARLPCPRCRSRDTKFCYFNNYNVNQPRHFCRACHRYWTAGGALRNVPVGSGRRKNRVTLPLSSSPHAFSNAFAGDDQQRLGGGGSSSPTFGATGASFFPPYHQSSSLHVTQAPDYNAAGLADATEQWWCHVTSNVIERSVVSSSPF